MNIVIVVFLVFLISIYIYINLIYKKYSRKEIKKGMSGFEVARTIIDTYDLNSIYITESREELYSTYDHKRKVIKLIKGVFNDTSITSCAIAAYEAAYAILDKKENKLFKFKRNLAQFINMLVYLGYFILICGCIFGHLKTIWLGFGLEIVVVLFHIFTYKVEQSVKEIGFNELIRHKIISSKEKKEVKQILNVSSLICISSVIFPVAELLKMIYNFGKSD